MYVHLNLSLSNNRLIHVCLSDTASILRFPRKLSFQPGNRLSKQIAAYLVSRLRPHGEGWPTIADVLGKLPKEMQRWSKVRVKHGGDAIRGSTGALETSTECDSSYVRVSEFILLRDISE